MAPGAKIPRRAFCAGLGVLFTANAARAQDGPALPAQAVMDLAFTEFAAWCPSLAKTDVVAIVDFSIPSYYPRLFIMRSDHRSVVASFLVSHGLGSDPGSTPSACPRLFSNSVGSLASCVGGFITSHTYAGAHGLSLKIRGVDPSNDNAERRDIVVHSARYVDPARARAGLPIERSNGCFAVSPADRDQVIEFLRGGAFLFAGTPDTAPAAGSDG